MCGIYGEFVYKSSDLLAKDNFLELLNLSKHRGPDSQGYYANDHIQFGFNRLAILDLSDNANQPIRSPSDRYTMVFNGEIYNHIDLRCSLPQDKFSFKGNGDTESLIACFDHYGIKTTTDKLDGMFAIGIFDHRDNKLHLIRDFAGIKPLHYGWNDNVVVFASQYNQISRHNAFYNEYIDEEVLKLYLTQHFIPPPLGLLNNTFSVSPGEIVTFDNDGKRNITTYWTFPEYKSEIEDQKGILSQIEDVLTLSVQSELISDVPIGAFLSGGVDSPLICYYASKISGSKFDTFSMGSDSYVHDESYQAKRYSESLGTNHHSIYMNAENSLEALQTAVFTAGEPFGDFSILPTWQLSKLAREEVTVALSGDGGDELFFGYERFQSIGKNHFLWKYPYSIRYGLRGLDKLLFNERQINECILAPNPGVAHKGLHSRFHIDWLKQIAPNLLNTQTPTSFNIYNYCNPPDQDELLHQIRKAEFYGMLQKTLTKVDRASMAHGLEIRVPFLKKSFLETILKMGVQIHKPMQGRKNKLFALLNKCYPSIPPEKNKKGFSISLSNWIKTSYKEPFRETLLDGDLCNSFGFNKSAIESMLNTHIINKEDLKWPLFSLYSLAIWDQNGRTII